MIAHEVNNTTAGITSTLDTVDGALECMEDTEDLREVMKVCIERCYSMSRFITNFANVVKIPEPQLQSVDLNDRVAACKTFMETVCRNRKITLHLNLCKENPEVMMDTSLFEQVLVNIIKNAAESIGETGDIFIRTSVSPTMLKLLIPVPVSVKRWKPSCSVLSSPPSLTDRVSVLFLFVKF